MYFPEDMPVINKLHEDAKEILRKREEFKKKECCPRCGNSRSKIDRGICKGDHLTPDGRKSLCFLRW